MQVARMRAAEKLSTGAECETGAQAAMRATRAGSQPRPARAFGRPRARVARLERSASASRIVPADAAGGWRKTQGRPSPGGPDRLVDKASKRGLVSHEREAIADQRIGTGCHRTQFLVADKHANPRIHCAKRDRDEAGCIYCHPAGKR